MSSISLTPGSHRGAELMERAVRGRSLWDDARRRLFSNRAALASMIVLGLLVLAAAIGPLLIPFRYDQISKTDTWLPAFSGAHVLGTDALGRDLLARLCVGLRISLTIGVVATAVSLVKIGRAHV